jgi:transcriptional regulator with XRE-family HTH domain
MTLEGMSKFRLARMSKGLKQIDLARLAGITEILISRIETGRSKPTPEVVAKIANALGVPASQLE